MDTLIDYSSDVSVVVVGHLIETLVAVAVAEVLTPSVSSRLNEQ